MLLALLLLGVPATVLGYDGQVASQVIVNGSCPPVGASGTSSAAVTATVVDAAGNPLSGIDLTWAVGDGAASAGGVTDANGRATTSLLLPAGDSTVVASAGGTQGSAVVTCPTGGVGGTTGLPRTDTRTDIGRAPWVGVALLAILYAALLFAGIRTERGASARS